MVGTFIMKNHNFEGKVVLVVGGNAGVGKFVAKELQEMDAQVIIADKTIEKPKFESRDPNAKNPTAFKLDLRNINQINNLFKTIKTRFGRLDGLFYYSGVTTPSVLSECVESHYDEIMAVNLKGALFCCKYAVGLMEQGGGSIVLTGSPHAWGGDKDRIVYACSKGALIPLVNHMARHYAAEGIRTNLVTMGWTATEGELRLRQSENITEDQLHEKASKTIPAGRMCTVEEVARSVLFLLSEQSEMTSGSNIRVTGGWYL
jgi:NAD(P)-dependent dehydrogenase (short-subunit alcohol dehydrogenase family)